MLVMPPVNPRPAALISPPSSVKPSVNAVHLFLPKDWAKNETINFDFYKY